MCNEEVIKAETKEHIRAFSEQCGDPEMKSFLEKIVKEYIAIGENDTYGGKHCGSDAERKGAEYIYDTLRTIGVDAEILPFQSTRFQFNDASIEYQGQTREIKPYACLSVPAAEGITAPLADLEDGSRQFYDTHDIRGRIALIETKEDFEDGTIVGSFQMYEAEKHGAAAIILYTKEYIYDEKTIRATYSLFRSNIPVVTICSADADMLKEEMAKNEDFSITLKVDTELDFTGGTSHEVIGEIKGKTDERIIYSAHLDHFFRGVQDNVTAVATLLGIARGMKKSGYVPNRTITFVFSGSHEIGRLDSAAPDLLGPYKLLKELKPEWAGKVIADINFEYTGMSLRNLRAIASYEMTDMYKDFAACMPDRMPGYEGVAEEVLPEEYYLMTWADSCVFIMNGIPVFMNDAVYEQIYEETSPYMERDHSNMDDLSIYSAEAHVGTTEWFGCLGLYLDGKAVIEPDYRERCAVLALDEEEKSFLESQEIRFHEYLRNLKKFGKYAEAASELLRKYNSRTAAGSDESLYINSMILKAQKLLADGTDGLTTSMPSMISVPHKVYMEKARYFADAMELMRTSGYEKAYDEALKKIDMVGLERKFSEDLIIKIKSFILGENATWNENKSRNFFIYSDVSEDRIQDAYQQNLNDLQAVFDEESRCLSEVSEILEDVIFAASEHADHVKMMEWIKGFTKFPHRKTGTEEGRRSAEYVENMFREKGLSNVETEPVKSMGMDCPEYRLNIGGSDVECFFVNGANRRAEQGDFVSEINDAEVVYLGRGKEEDFRDVDVEGKIVVCDVYFRHLAPMEMLDWCEGAEIYDPEGRSAKPMNRYDIYTPNDWPYNYLLAREKKAAGFVGILHNFMDCHYYHEDYRDIVNIDGYMDLPALWVSGKDGEKIKEDLRSAPLRGSMTVRTVYEECEAMIVKGEIKGKSDEIIVVHSHHDAVNRGAVQDGSGMSVVFALAEYFSGLPEELIDRTLMFVATDSHYTDYEGHVGFLENRKKNGDNIVMDFCIEHIAEEMDLDEDNNMILTGEAETRMMYVQDKDGLFEFVKKAVEKFDLQKTVLFPVKGRSSGDYTNDDVCSDAYDFNAAGIPVVSILSAPMYLFHDSDDIDKVHAESLDKVFAMYAYMILNTLDTGEENSEEEI